MTRKSTLSTESAALIKHLKENGASTAAVLQPHFPSMGRTQLLKRLGNLVDLGWLDYTRDSAGDKSWSVRASARAKPVHTVAVQAASEAAAATSVAQPRRVNVMAGAYAPARSPALRAGSLDFRACPSVGYRC